MPVLVFASYFYSVLDLAVPKGTQGPSATCTDIVDQTPWHHRPSGDTALPLLLSMNRHSTDPPSPSANKHRVGRRQRWGRLICLRLGHLSRHSKQTTDGHTQLRTTSS